MAKLTTMKNFIFLILPVLLFSNGACEDKKNSTKEDSGPFLTKEAIFAELGKEYEGIQENDVCIEEVEELNTLFVVGFFAYDRGCSVDRIFYNGYQLKGDHSEAYKIMQGNDFKGNSEKLVETYHIQVINVFKTVVWDSNEDFSEGEHFKPRTRIEGDQVISELWIQRPSGMIRERFYYLSTLTFSKDGNFVSLTTTNQFSVSFE